MLLLDGVCIGVGGASAVEDLSLEVRDHEVLGLIGPSGAGKSAVVDCVTGLCRPSAGRVLLGEQDLTRLAFHRIASLGVARTFQQPAPSPALSVAENVGIGRKASARSSVLAAARCWRAGRREDAGEREVVDGILSLLELADLRDTPVGALPCGLRKRVELGRALAIEPRLLLIDDATSGLTVDEKEQTVRIVRRIHAELGVTVVFVSQDLGVTTELCDRVVVLDRGRKVAEGPPAEIRKDARVLRAYLGDTVLSDAI